MALAWPVVDYRVVDPVKQQMAVFAGQVMGYASSIALGSIASNVTTAALVSAGWGAFWVTFFSILTFLVTVGVSFSIISSVIYTLFML